MTEKQPRNILSIESAVATGSVALICDKQGLVIRREGVNCSRAEELISIVAQTLEDAALKLRDLDLIAVSTGPGNYSGIRIGMSTALGLASAVGIECVGLSVLEAMAAAAGLTGTFLVAIPVGKKDVAWQRFSVDSEGDHSAETPSELLSSVSFIDQLKGLPLINLLLQTDLLDRIRHQIPATTPWLDAGIGLAEFVGRLASRQRESDGHLQPIYLRNRDAAVRSPGF
ncbi:MAG: tRNA (adenosine(37)-N6)-threonylcarbamoyltransferase complex dimerization subunit type 1 TsaB [Pyrinomonadaceae bacterium]